uniref:F-box protein PP2-B10 isoform X1 n=1 Tax=Nicotiana tabacum TaxID=4097 RepID=A0A1S3ZX34_TOBAC|nr:PREDICTED: F-box protein PP2-B10-like isoform X1 [Nicotiana tabacum]
MENSNANGEYENERITTCLWMLPEDCIAKILAFTSPLDVCRFSLVSKPVRPAAESDSVWEKFLPSDYESIVAGSMSPIPDFHSKKDLYVHLCHHPLLIDAGRKSFSLEKWTGKKCYFLGARDLNIAWGDTPDYWKWTSLQESRFPEVAELILVWWLEIWGTIRAGILSPQTSYVAYLVYKLEDEFGFHYRPSEISVGVSGVEFDKRFAFLVPDGRPQRRNRYVESDDDYEEPVYTPPSDVVRCLPEDASTPLQSDIQRPKLRDDGWFEIQLGEFFTENEDDCILMSMKEVNDSVSQKEGLIVEGIEIRPRMG